MGIFDKKKLEKLRAAEKKQAGHTILLVDDEVSNLQVLSTLLEGRFHVLTAEGGEEALRLVKNSKRPISLIITDQRMPGIKGTEFLQQMIELSPKTIRIMLTGYSDINAVIDSINRSHIFEFIHKPFDSDEILQAVERAICSFESAREAELYQSDLEKKISERTKELERKNRELEEAYAELANKHEALKVAHKQLEEISLTDVLTGLRNRRYLIDYMKSELGLLQRFLDKHGAETKQKPFHFGFFMLDLDNFKNINDTYGHGVGDQVLLHISQLLNHACRSSDFVVRWGGEEFLVVVRNTPNEDMSILAERFRSLVEQKPYSFEGGGELKMTCSLGYAPFPFCWRAYSLYDWEECVALADAALYAAKRSTKNAWVGLLPGPDFPLDKTFEDFRENLPALIDTKQLIVTSSHKEPVPLEWGRA
ncbi:MAG: hypothetical protein CL920_28685 [Deltaproteobacteria bacterium]|nr:hypothetical protein [Deltaproteobacteria bacterium]MBU52693.1 hypothetical protein [Deltaproteobacteria bacterium]|tara:strand:- start:6083 stop:7348 length:1266 start_codon:yes stop_codon:yes gene_type:complete